jgi:hypothetical protein
MSRAFWAARRPGWVAGGLVVAITVMTVWLLGAKSGVNDATVLALPVSILSLAIAVRGLVPSRPLSAVARELAERVAQERGRSRRQATGMSGDADPADVAFRTPLPGEEQELVRWRSDGGPEDGTLRTIAHFYRSLDRGRLVVLGEPGAGKTVLASQLIIDLLKEMPQGELQPGGRPPVPTWLTLTSVDLGDVDELARATAEDLAVRLDQQIAMQISATYQIPGSVAESLVREHWVLPVLDGLDEMDPSHPADSGHARPRATAVIRALNAGTGRKPTVLVCRRGEYGQMARSPGTGGEDPVLQDARQIILQPLDVTAICDYLIRRFPGDQPGQPASRWQYVYAELEASAARGDETGLSRVLSSPWRLFLATTAYQDEDSDPSELLWRPADDLSERLLGQLIPATVYHKPRRGGDHYQPGQVQSWLTALARHLDQTSNDPALRWSPTELQLERLWPIAGRTKVQRLSTITYIVLLGAAFGVEALMEFHNLGGWNQATWPFRLSLILMVAFIIGLVIYLRVNADLGLARLSIRFTSHTDRRRLTIGLAAGLAVGLAAGLATGLTGGLTFGLATGLPTGPAVGLAVGLRDAFSLAAQPTSVMRQSTAFALAAGLTAGLAAGLGLDLALGLAYGLAIGLAVGLPFGLAVWIRYLIACWLARREGILPPRVGQFLDWAYRANLLRLAGTSAQFRHREFQAWLMSNAETQPGEMT